MHDVAARLKNRVQLTTDGFKPYVKAEDAAFDGEIDFAPLVKLCGKPEAEGNERRYSPVECVGSEKKVTEGRPQEEHISTPTCVANAAIQRPRKYSANPSSATAL